MAATERGRNEIFFADYATGTWSGGYVGILNLISVQSYLGLKATGNWGKHLFKTGFEYQENRLDNDGNENTLFRYGPTSYQYFQFMSKGKVANRVPSMFVQDSWGLSERIRINTGLRWDGQILVGSNGKVVQKILDQYQPRLGLIYQIGEIGSQKILGSFGRFYQELLTTLSSASHIAGGVSAVITYDHDPRTNPAGGDSSYTIPSIVPEVKDLEGQYYDEFILGYERLFGKSVKLGLRGIYRPLQQAIQTGFFYETGEYTYGNFGKGRLSMFPKAKRDYTALELTLEKTGGKRLNFLTTYILSRNYCNYTGFFDSDINKGVPNALFHVIEDLNNATGLLPNNRTHVLKFSGAYHSDWGLTLGTAFSWQSRTPLNEFGGHPDGFSHVFLRQRGTAGRTPSVWDLNLRLADDLNRLRHNTWKPRLILDVFHFASQRQPVLFEEFHYFSVDENGNQINPNPLYGQATRFQPPMAVRLGLEIEF